MTRHPYPTTGAEDGTAMPRSAETDRRPLRRSIAVVIALLLGAGLLTATPAAAGSWPADMTCLPGTYKIHTGAGMVLTASEEADEHKHGRIIQHPYDGDRSQRWTVCYKVLDHFHNLEFEFVSAVRGGPWCMGVKNGYADEGADLWAQECSNLRHQRFKKHLSSTIPAPGQPEWFSLQVLHDNMFVAIKDYTVYDAQAAQYTNRADMFWYDPA
ncbi:RICIN domain-containing protein [Embleya sp. AB8]|uniref:RICIN domain-containing protein n=1 Tax=Embleya sp. AB8 TaxID=3156304 RepID=UPI003C75BAFF